MTVEPDHLPVLIFHQTPSEVMVGLSRSGTIIAETAATIPYREASKALIPCVKHIMDHASISLSELAYLACNRGPAPFTTLRTVVVTVNGLGYAIDKPLIGVNGLLCLAKEYHAETYQRTYALMNAFGNNVYYAIYDPASSVNGESGTATCHDIAEEITNYSRSHPEAGIQILGGAADFYKGYLQHLNHASIYINSDITHASLQAIAHAAADLWNIKSVVYELKPYYGTAL